MGKRIERLSRRVVECWYRWLDAPGWDNNELQPLQEAVDALDKALGLDAPVPHELGGEG
jgi:hypothetical protein